MINFSHISHSYSFCFQMTVRAICGIHSSTPNPFITFHTVRLFRAKPTIMAEINGRLVWGPFAASDAIIFFTSETTIIAKFCELFPHIPDKNNIISLSLDKYNILNAFQSFNHGHISPSLNGILDNTKHSFLQYFQTYGIRGQPLYKVLSPHPNNIL